MNVSVIIPAAGASERFGPTSKLDQDLGGRPLLLRTVELFAKRSEVHSIVVVGPAATAAEPERFEAFRERFAPTLGFHGATVVEGGATRTDSVRNGLAAVPSDATHIAVHDAARPGASADLLNRIFEAAQTLDAVLPGLPMAATVKRLADAATDARADDEDALADLILGDAGKVSIDARAVVETVNRADLVMAQTPQIFAADLLRRAYADPGDGATDDAGLVERLGDTVHVIEGDPANFKITTPRDLEMMRRLLGLKEPAGRPAHKRF
jgi:2-C-methyl-D-erythritol 4-phosphate cytidylyltransferase